MHSVPQDDRRCRHAYLIPDPTRYLLVDGVGSFWMDGRSNYTVFQKSKPQTLAVTLSNLNRFQKFFHRQTQQEICYRPTAIQPFLTYVTTLLCEA